MKKILENFCRSTLHKSWFAALLVMAFAAPVLAEKRVALVIGNSGYENAGRLKNPGNDAADMAANLKKLGFEVIRAINLDGDGFYDAYTRFSKQLENADISLLFYAGHGIQFKGRNYLVPVDAKLKNEFSIRRETFPLTDFIEIMEKKSKVNLVFLDACRNNPLASRLNHSMSKTRSIPLLQGLKRIAHINSETLIVYATAPDAVAADGRGRNSPFTSALLRHIATPGIEVEVMLKRVTRTVRSNTRELQKPERLSQLTTEFYFNRQTRASQSTSLAEKQILDLQQKLYDKQRKESHKVATLRLPAPKLKFAGPLTVRLPGGRTILGCVSKKTCRSDELPTRAVVLKPFHMAKYETSFAQWDECVAGGGCRVNRDDEGWGRGNRPVVNVSWHDARAYVRWLSQKTGQKWRLPTEAEWEYGARAGSKTRYSFGNELSRKQANFGGTLARTKPVGQYDANRLGLFDMHGNVFEWVNDRYGKNYYASAPLENPAGPQKGERRINRGGGWHYDGKYARSAMRVAVSPGKRLSNVGFRVVREQE